MTNAQYSLFVKATGRDVPTHWEKGEVLKGRKDHPGVYVSWYDAQEFCKWVHGETGRKFSLPSEVEWEYAAWGGL